MELNKALTELRKDYICLQSKYLAIMPNYEFGYALIRYAVKMLMDEAPRHGIALETIKVATEEGIKWHVEERVKQNTKGEIK